MENYLTFDQIEVGKKYISFNSQFNATIKIACVSDDFNGLSRRIKYFVFSDRLGFIPSQSEFVESLKDDALTLPDKPTNRQIKKVNRLYLIRKNCFALWDWAIEGDLATNHLSIG